MSEKKKTCTCRNTNCLQNYCECIKAGLYCNSDCRCINCKNLPEHEKERNNHLEAQMIKQMTSPKLSKNGCRCKKINCRSRYCACFNAGIACTEDCECVDCENDKCESKHPNGKRSKLPSKMWSYYSYQAQHQFILPLAKKKKGDAHLCRNWLWASTTT